MIVVSLRLRVYGESLKQDNERHISGCARYGSVPIVCDVVINKLNLTCAFLPPLSSFKLMIWFPFNSTHTSTDPCRSAEYAPPFVAEKVHFQLEGSEILLHKYLLCIGILKCQSVVCGCVFCIKRTFCRITDIVALKKYMHFLSFYNLSLLKHISNNFQNKFRKSSTLYQQHFHLKYHPSHASI